MWMNTYEIDETVEIIAQHAPQLAKYAKFLADWRDTVNANSDGWAHWTGGTKPADSLSTLLKAVVDHFRTGQFGRSKPLPTDAQFRKALAPIRAAATKHNLTAPTLQDESSKSRAKASSVAPLDSQTFVTIAQRHGEDSEPDHEVGDLQAFFRAAYDMLTPEQRECFLARDDVRETIESALVSDPLPSGPAAADAVREILEASGKPTLGR